MQYTRLFSILLVGLIMVSLIEAKTVPMNSPIEKEGQAEEILLRQARNTFDWQCTTQCARYWRCELQGFFIFGDCDGPQGCECSSFY